MGPMATVTMLTLSPELHDDNYRTVFNISLDVQTLHHFNKTQYAIIWMKSSLLSRLHTNFETQVETAVMLMTPTYPKRRKNMQIQRTYRMHHLIVRVHTHTHTHTHTFLHFMLTVCTYFTSL